MNIPLPRATSQAATWTGSGHAGLWFDKFCQTWNHQWKIDAPAKKGWLATLAKQDKRIGNASLLTEHAQRAAILAKALGGICSYFRTQGRFATGLGREHPIENGFAWHPSLGVPYLPGSSVKGLVRAWAHRWEKVDADTEYHAFGGKASEQVGSVIFFDALPTKPVQLEADVMTPHYGPYYQDQSGKTAPGDWHSPTPIPFLTVAANQSFLFALAPRTPSEADREACQIVAQWLATALLELGAGAKTAVGYGRFVPDPEAEADARQAEEEAARKKKEEAEAAAFAATLADLSPLARELRQAARTEDWETNASAFKAQGVREKWMERLEADPQPDAIAYFGELLEKHDKGILENPDRKEGKKQKPAYKEASINIAKRWIALRDKS